MVKSGLVLLIITAIASACLGFVNQITTPIIDANQLAAKQAAMSKLLTEVTDNNFSEEITAEADTGVLSYNIGYAGAETVGYVLMVDPVGYGGAINILVGLNADGVIQGIEIVSMAETPGLGANAKKPKFMEQFVSKTGEMVVVKSAPKGANEIEAITSATITSQAITDGVNNALKYYENYLKGGGK